MMANKEEGKLEMVANKCNSVHAKRNKKSLTTIESLPEELVFNILIHLPGEDIYNYAILVCWKWYRMIHTRDFVHSHLRHSTPGLLIQMWGDNHASIFIALGKDRVEVSEFSHKLRGGSWASCNGLIAEYDHSTNAFEIINPAIKQHFAIPRFFTTFSYRCSIAYSAASMEYKLVRNYDIKDGDSWVSRWAILTLGVDKSWRYVCTQHLSQIIRATVPFVTEGFIHWPSNGTHVLTLNVETEVITETPAPQGYRNRIEDYFSSGKSLSMLVRCNEFSFEVWDMKSETGEWKKMPNIDLEGQKCKFEHLYCKKNPQPFLLVPAGWLKYQEVFVFFVNHTIRDWIAYNVRTQKMDFFEFDHGCMVGDIRVHTNSLVWFSGS